MKKRKQDTIEEIHHVITNQEVKNSEPKIVKLKPNYPEDDVIGFLNPQTEQTVFDVDISRPVRIYCDGIYDIFHYGHARSLKQAKGLFPNSKLIVGIPHDSLTHSLKGDTVMDASERIESLRHCRYVDEIIENAPWVITPEFMAKYKIDFIAHDDIPYSGVGMTDIYAKIKQMKKFIPTKRTNGISTTGIITNIVKRYDLYVRRNLERGISAKDLNISKLTELDYKMQKQLVKLGMNVKELKMKIESAIARCDDFGNVCLDKFIKKFGKDGLWGRITKNREKSD